MFARSSRFAYFWTSSLSDLRNENAIAHLKRKNIGSPAPTITITGPLENTRFIAPATFTMTASATVAEGTIAKVEYMSGGSVIGVASVAPYNVRLDNVLAGTYSVIAKATSSLGAASVSAPLTLVVAENIAPVITLLTNPETADSPANVMLIATATDAGTIAKVQFFNGETLLATLVQRPYTFIWNGVSAGIYGITARATDDSNLTTTTGVHTLSITPPSAIAESRVFYIFADQVNTAREITAADGTIVWKSDSEPFGANLPNENPSSRGKFSFNQRFPGQYFDRETGLHYNYHRDYDPQTGRYVQSDPIGLAGGLNTFAYADGDPLRSADPTGLSILIDPRLQKYVDKNNRSSAESRKIINAMANDSKVSYILVQGTALEAPSGGSTRIDQAAPGIFDAILGRELPRATIVMTIDPNSTTTYTDESGREFLPPPERIIAHELGHGYTYLEGGFVGYQQSYHDAIDTENIICRQVNPKSPRRPTSDHGGIRDKLKNMGR